MGIVNMAVSFSGCALGGGCALKWKVGLWVMVGFDGGLMGIDGFDKNMLQSTIRFVKNY